MERRMSARCLGLAIMSLIIAFCLAVMPGQALARSLSMEAVNVDAEVLPDASMQVTEHLTVNFSGQWNGFYIKIPQGNTPVREVVVRENGQPYKFNPGTTYGPPGTYLVKTEGDLLTIDWSISALDQVRTFDVSYRVVNAVQVHKDGAELYRKFIGDDNGNPIGRVKVNIKLPPGAERYRQGEDIRIWGHGPLNGEIVFTGPDTVVLEVSDLPAYTFVEGRVVMPAALFPSAPPSALTGKTSLPGILAEEEDWADQANRQRLVSRLDTSGGLAALLGSLAAVIWLWFRYGRRHPTSFQGDYYRELPADYSPAELSVLWNKGKIEARDLTATIMDLARRKFLSLEEATVVVPRFLFDKEVVTYRLSLLPAPAAASLKKPEDAVLRPHEQELLEFLRAKISEGRGFLYLTDIEQYAKKHGQDFYEFWEKWASGLKARGVSLKFFDDSGMMPVAAILSGIGMVILGMVLLFIFETYLFSTGLIIGGIMVAVIPALYSRRSKTGQEDYVRWQAFKRFLEHFSEMDKHEIPSLIIWEHYLVYAVTLGVAKEVIRQLELVFPNLQDGDYHFGTGWMTYGHYAAVSNVNQSFDNIGDSMDRALSSARAAVSKSSSGHGGGGGFSGGGGGGGGGSSFGGR